MPPETKPADGAPLKRLRQPERSKLLQEAMTTPVSEDVLVQTRALSVALVRDGLREQASDIHLDPTLGGYLIRFRVDGVLIDTVTLDDESGTRLVRSLKSHAGMETGYTLLPQEGRADFDLSDRRLPLRVSTAPTLLGEKMALRFLLPNLKRFRLAELGLGQQEHAKVASALEDSLGMVIVCGPTGSGKTTTVYALLHELKNRNESIVTLEDPAEDLIEGVVQIQINEKQGLSFASGVKGILRLDPDAIMMGELRDAASARSALDAADSGHLFLTTLHARDAAGAITALRNHGMADYAIAASVDLVIAQRLVRKLCPACRKQAPPNEAELRLLKLGRQVVPGKVWRAVGCAQCGMTGYKGRVGVFEVWPLTEPHCELILQETNELALRRRLRKDGVASLFDDMFAKAAEGHTTLSEMQAIGGFGLYSSQPPQDPASIKP